MRTTRAAMAALALLGAVSAGAQTPTPAPMGAKVSVKGAPDVQVMVAPVKGGAQVALVFPKVVSDARIRQHIASVAKALGTPAEAIQVVTRKLVREDPSKVGQAPEMSSGSFVTTAPLIDPAAGTLAVEPLLIGLQNLTGVNIVFLTPPGFAYRGGTRSADNRVALEFAGGEGAYTFVANIQSRPLDGFRLALESAAPPARAAGRSGPAPIALILVGALAVGGAAGTFVALRRMGGR